MEFLIHEFPALYSILKAHKGPNVGAVIPGHALHVLKTVLYLRALCKAPEGHHLGRSIRKHSASGLVLTVRLLIHEGHAQELQALQ